MDDVTIRLAASLTEIATRNTYDVISTKLAATKKNKKIEEQQAAYEEIINSLLKDKVEIERVASEYKDLYERVTISDEDIEHLQKTFEHVMNLFVSFSVINKEQEENIKLIKGLINKDTLKTMQLLGFNYKEAIGEPLTEVCANGIKNNLTKGNKSGQMKKQTKK